MSELNKYLMFIIFLMIVSIVLQSITLYKASQKQERYGFFDSIGSALTGAATSVGNAAKSAYNSSVGQQVSNTVGNAATSAYNAVSGRQVFSLKKNIYNKKGKQKNSGEKGMKGER